MKKVVLVFVVCILVMSLPPLNLVSPSFAADSQWIPIGPEGGFLLSFAIAPNSPNVLYGGSDVYGGIYKSTDSGETWEFMGMITELGEILDIAIHPDSSDIVYAACSSGSVYRTTDGGLNWEHIFSKKGLAYSLGIDPDSPNVVYAGFVVDTAEDYALYRSIDGGETWPDSSFQGNPVLEIRFDPDSLNTLYAGTSYGVHRSTDAGESWIFCGPPTPSATIYSLVVIDSNTYYAGTYADDRDSGTVYKTTNGGVSWDTVYKLGTTVWSLAVDPDIANIIYLAAGSNMFGSEGVFKTTDGGDNWFPVNDGLTDRMVRIIKIDPVSPNTLYVTTDGLGGVYKSTDGAATWSQKTSGMRYTLVQAMCFDASHTLYAAVGWGTYRDIPSIFRSPDGGTSWESLKAVPSPYYMTSVWDIVAHPDSSDLIYVAGMSHYVDTEEEPTRGLLHRSCDGGKTWEELWMPEDIWILCLAIDPISETIYAGTGGADTSRIYRVYRSTDRGNTWEETSGWQSPGNSIFEIAVDPTSPNRLYAGTGGAVFKSTDYGVNWIPQAVIPIAYTLLIDPNSPNTLYAGSGGPYAYEGGVYKSTDSGATWGSIGLEAHAITKLCGIFGSENTIYAGTGGKFLETSGSGLFRSADNGTSWEPMNSNLSSPFILSLLIDPDSPSTIYAGTMGGGIFKLTEATGIEAIDRGHIENATFCISNFPNPFNTTTQIAYRIPTTSHVTLKIFDTSGRFITVLVDEQEQAGYHQIAWDGTNRYGTEVGTGIYYIRMRAGEQLITRKVMLIK